MALEAFSPAVSLKQRAQPAQNSYGTSCCMPQHQAPGQCPTDWHRSPGPVRTQSLHPSEATSEPTPWRRWMCRSDRVQFRIKPEVTPVFPNLPMFGGKLKIISLSSFSTGYPPVENEATGKYLTE